MALIRSHVDGDDEGSQPQQKVGMMTHELFPRRRIMLMLFLTVALVHIVALMSPGLTFSSLITNRRQPAPQREAMMGVLEYY